MNTVTFKNMTGVELLVEYIRQHGIEAHELNGKIFAHNWSVSNGERFLEIDEVVIDEKNLMPPPEVIDGI